MDEQDRTDFKHMPARAADAAGRVADEVADVAASAKDTVTGFGRRTIEQLDAQRHPASQTLNRTASVVHRQADAAAGAAHAAADTLQATADYVGGHDVKAMSMDALGLVRRYPGPALLVAGMLGFIVARAARARA